MEAPNIKNDLLNDIAEFVSNDIDGVTINDTVKITSFTEKRDDKQNIVIEYEIPDGSVTEVKNIKLKKGNVVLSESDVYIPVTDAASLKHKIQIAEGE